jgi:hypothetical protein
MNRKVAFLVLLVTLSPCHLVTLSSSARADAFDYYTNPVLAKVPGADGVKEVTRLTPALLIDNDRVLPGVTQAMVVVKTNDGRWSKLLVQIAGQKVDENRTLPILLIDRLTTYKEGAEQTVQASARNLSLFGSFRLSLDLGQVVPEELGGDLKFVTAGDKSYAEPVGRAKLYLLTKPLPEAAPKKSAKPVVGDKFEPRYLNGSYKLYDDGRRSGKLTLKLEEGGEISGSYISDKDGEKYEVKGKLGMPQYHLEFTVKFPRTEQVFQAWLFTGDARALTGSSRMLDREAGFYAVRIDEE